MQEELIQLLPGWAFCHFASKNYINPMQKFFTCLLAIAFFSAKMAAQCTPQLLDCPASPVTFCDNSLNASDYWNETYWWDGANQSHDLAEAETNLAISFRDTCASGYTVHCQLFLDLDNDGVLETVVDSDDFPEAGVVHYGNVINFGSPRRFDERPVPADQKWLFALQTAQNGDTTTTSLRWNTAAAPGVFALPQLPLVSYKMHWEVRDNASVVKQCTFDFVVKDCESPEIQCISGLSVNIMPTHFVQLWATDFLWYVNDNNTSQPNLRLGIRKAGTGTGFPVNPDGTPTASVNFTCNELGPQLVELWAIDLTGNAEYCQTSVLVQDNQGNCNGFGGKVQACSVLQCTGDAISDELTYQLKFTDAGQEQEQYYLGNCAQIGQNLPTNIPITIKPLDGENATGVGTQDLVVISKHIAGIDTLNTPYQWVSADANGDGVINNQDVVKCRAHILGIQPLTHAWRFVEKSYVFPWPGNPLATPFPESVTVNLDGNTVPLVEFYAIPICDVSCGNVVGFFELDPENQHLIGDPQPNPTFGGTQLPLRLVTGETVQFEMTDASGRLVLRSAVSLPEGPAMLDIPAEAMAMPGLYFWRATVGGVVASGKISRL